MAPIVISLRKCASLSTKDPLGTRAAISCPRRLGLGTISVLNRSSISMPPSNKQHKQNPALPIFHNRRLKVLKFYFLHTVLISSCTMRAGIWNTNRTFAGNFAGLLRQDRTSQQVRGWGRTGIEPGTHTL